MKPARPILFALTLMTVASAASAQGAPPLRPPAIVPAADDRPAREQEAWALIEILQPPDLVVDTIIGVLDRDMVKTLQAGPAFRELEASNPGFLQAYWTALKPVMVKALRDRIPAFRQRATLLYADRMTLAELRAARAFFSGAIGQRMIALLHQNADFDSIMAEVARHPGAEIPNSSYEASMETTVRAAEARLTEEEKAGIIVFRSSSAGKKLEALAAEMDRIADESMNAPDPELDARIIAIRDEVLARLSTGRKPD